MHPDRYGRRRIKRVRSRHLIVEGEHSCKAEFAALSNSPGKSDTDMVVYDRWRKDIEQDLGIRYRLITVVA